jgi:ubiquinone/menaquinone biosynthesis C-methylase UbiE
MSKKEYNSVNYITEPLSSFEEEYKSIRDKEGRWLSDEAVKKLPLIDVSSPMVSEWKKRAWMLNKLETYMSLGSFDNVLDIGCGNGWMTNRISKLAQNNTTGLDVGKKELEQAARCFGNEKVQFTCCSDWSLLPKEGFDLITFAGSFHYFDPTPDFWEMLLSLLRTGGEIHILETQFYQAKEVAAAQQRSQEYFEKMGATVDYYKHLSWDVLPENHEIIYLPGGLNKLFKNRSPFPWIRIRK